MDDDSTKEEIQPSTSKKDTQRTNSRNDLYDHDRGHEEGASNSETSVTATYSAKSRVEMVDARPEQPKTLALGKRAAKAPEKKKRARRSGRVEKRRRSYRRQLRRAPLRRKQGLLRQTRAEGRRLRDHSISTIFSGLSSRSGSRIGCVRCGHRCCRRRAKRFVVRVRRCTCRRCGRRMHKKKMVVTKKSKKKPVEKFFPRQFTVLSKEIQTGSRSHMLSPLFINTNSTPEAEVVLPGQTYCEVTPEMIFESLCVLNLWKEEVQTALIMKYIVRNYPVNRQERELFQELSEKLRIAAIVGIVIQTNEDLWSLPGELEQRKLTSNHVTLFWKAYSDTLSPMYRKMTHLQKDSAVLPSKTTRRTDSWDKPI